jgi:hypothetical protein
MSIKGFIAFDAGDVVSRNNCCHLTKSFDKEILIEDTERERGGGIREDWEKLWQEKGDLER